MIRERCSRDLGLRRKDRYFQEHTRPQPETEEWAESFACSD